MHYYNSTGAANVWMYAYTEDGTAIFGTWDSVTSKPQAKLTSVGNGWMDGTIPAGSAYVIFRLSGGKQEPGMGESGYLVADEAWISGSGRSVDSEQECHLHLHCQDQPHQPPDR